jgi:tripartite motif-containing protein 71
MLRRTRGFIAPALLALSMAVSVSVAQPSYVYQSSFGTPGKGNGQFSGVTDIDIGTIGGHTYLYALDGFDLRVQYFTLSGVYKGQFRTSGGATHAQISMPMGMCWDSSGYIWVADVDSVRKLSPTGAWRSQIGEAGDEGASPGEFSGACDVQRTPRYLYVCDFGNNRIQKFDTKGNFVSSFGGSGSGNGQLDHPNSLAVDNSGNVYVADAFNHRIEKFDANGNYISQFGSKGTDKGKFQGPSCVRVDKNGNIWVVGYGDDRVQEFSSSGTFLTAFGTQGKGRGQFDGPGTLVLDSSGNVYVTDTGNDRVEKWVPSRSAAPHGPRS